MSTFRCSACWPRRTLPVFVCARSSGPRARSVRAYNGALFAHDGVAGADVLERFAVPDSVLGPGLVALGLDEGTGTGVDFSGLEIGHLGHIYEGLLSLRLSVADHAYTYDAKRDRYVPTDSEEPEIDQGELLWLTDEGGRKGGGVYYTPEPLVQHLVRR